MLKKRILIGILVFVIVLGFAGGGYFLGFEEGRKYPEKIVIEGVQNMESKDVPGVDFATFWEAWQTINTTYLKSKNVNNADRVYGAIGGLVKSLGDPYSEFFPPEESKKFQQDVQGNFGGIGTELGMRKNQLVVIAPLKDTPASKAGILAGDQIVAINSSSTEGISIEEAVNRIRGPEGTQVTLTIYREDWEKSKDFTITRANIIIPTVNVSQIGNITRVELHSFNANAEPLFYEAVRKMSADNSHGLILDLRNNPGGYLQVAVDLAGWFLPKNTLVVSEEGRDKKLREFKASGNEALVNFPIVVLINKGSASASEILAGALRDQRKIKLIGETSFGKGTVQQLEDLHDGSSLKVTVAQWVLPSGQILEGDGLKPDVEIKITDEDSEKKRDPQLDKAVAVLKAEINGQNCNADFTVCK